MLLFKEIKDNDPNYRNWECNLDDGIVRILKNQNHPFYSVYIKHYSMENKRIVWYIEISSNKATTLAWAKKVAEKMYDIVLWYKAPEPWREY